MPVLNTVNYVEEALNSVVNQTLKEIEIICIDAGSTDGTLDILNGYCNKYDNIRLIKSNVKSYGYQMNLGLTNSLGEYIGVVEPDDFVEKDMFEKLYFVFVLIYKYASNINVLCLYIVIKRILFLYTFYTFCLIRK